MSENPSSYELLRKVHFLREIRGEPGERRHAGVSGSEAEASASPSKGNDVRISTDCLNLTVLLPEDLEELGSERSDSRDFSRGLGDSLKASSRDFLESSEDDRSLASADLRTKSGGSFFQGSQTLLPDF